MKNTQTNTVDPEKSAKLLAGSPPVSGAAQGPATVHNTGAVTSPATGPDPSAVVAVRTFHEGMVPLRNALAQYFRGVPANLGRHYKGVPARTVAVIPQLADILRRNPSLASSIRPDNVVAWMDLVNALAVIAGDLDLLLKQVEDTLRMTRIDAWRVAGVVYATARHQAKTDGAMATAVA